MTFDASAFFEKYLQYDARLVAEGFHPTSEFWRIELARLLRAIGSGDRAAIRRWVIRAGRRSGKSSTLARFSVVWALEGPHQIPRGDVGYTIVLSVNKDEAAARLVTIEAILGALGVPCNRAGDTIMLQDRPIGWCVRAATKKAVAGWTAILAIGDECALWEHDATGANPAEDIVEQLSPCLATMPYGFMALVSAPWGVDDYHAQLYECGDSESQLTSFAETWVGNPTLTEADTHVLQPDPKKWARQYAAIPGGTASAAFPAELLDRAMDRSPLTDGGLFCAIDMARPNADGRTSRDHHAMAIGRITENSLTLLEGESFPHGQVTSEVVAQIAEACKKHRVKEVWSDGYESQPIEFGKYGLTVHMRPYSATLKANAVDAFNRMLREERVSIPFPEVIGQLKQIQERLAPSGQRHYRTNGLDAACAAVFTPLIVCLADQTKYPRGTGTNYALAAKNLRAIGGAAALFGLRNVHVNSSMHRADCSTYGCPGCA